MYKVGIPKSAHPAMYDANVLGTQRVIDAAVDAGRPRIVYVSTGNVYGNTRRKVVDKSYDGLSRRISSPTTTRPSGWRTRSPPTGSPTVRRS